MEATLSNSAELYSQQIKAIINVKSLDIKLKMHISWAQYFNSKAFTCKLLRVAILHKLRMYVHVCADVFTVTCINMCVLSNFLNDIRLLY